MEDQLWTYAVITFMGLIILLQWFTNKWAIDERDWLKQKCYSLMGGNPITRDARLTEEYGRRKK